MKEAKEVILQQMEDLGEMTIENVMELVEPHFIFDSMQAKKSAIRRKSINLIAQLKDEKGVRKCFVIKDEEGTPKAINIDKNNDVKELEVVESSLTKSMDGYWSSIKKIKRRKQIIAGQITFDEVAASK